MLFFFTVLYKYGWKGFKEYLKLKLGRIDYLLFKDDNFETVYIQGYRKPILLRSRTTDFRTFKQIFHNKEYDIVFNFEPKNIIDAGANIGLAAIYFASNYPKANVYAIEPEASNYSKLLQTVVGYETINPIQAALHHTEGETLEVVDQGLGHWGFATREKSEVVKNNTMNQISTLSVISLINKFNLEKIDILKIDIEGAEADVFEKDYENWLPKVRCIIIEFHERFRPNSENNIKLILKGFGFASYQKGENWIFINPHI